MTREDVTKAAIKNGWIAWGKLRKYGNSSYQCFRRRSDYLWIGLAYVERTNEPIAVDFIREESETLRILK